MLIDLEAQTKGSVALQGTHLRSKSTNLCNNNCLPKTALSTPLTQTQDTVVKHKAKNCRNKEQKNQSSSSEGCSVPQQLLNQAARTELIL